MDKNMLKIKYFAGKLTLAAMLPAVAVLAGCGEDEPSVLPQGGGDDNRLGGIVVCGGSGDITAGTRYVAPGDGTSGPQIDGTCYADRLEVYPFFKTSGYTPYWPGAGEYNYQPDESNNPHVSVTTPIELNIMGRNGYADAQLGIEKVNKYIYMYTTALAYTDADSQKFTTSIGNRTSSTLSLENLNKTETASQNGEETVEESPVYSTPELYYGVLHMKDYSPEPSLICEWESDEDNYMWYHISEYTGSAALEGRIFRIVSQVNLTVTEIPDGIVEKIGLYTDNYPTEITLNGTHGANYPVYAVTDTEKTTKDKMVLLDEADIVAGQGSATLSSFLLPSEIGMHLKLLVTYTDEANKEPEYYDLRPQTSRYLTGTDAAAYSVGDGLKHGSDLIVYDGNAGKFCFYSYSNVRVNMSGAFNNIAAETGEANITIEVDPNFEDLHEFEIK